MATTEIQTRPWKSIPEFTLAWEMANEGLGHRFELRLVREDDGGFSAYVSELAGVHSQGNTETEARANIEEALKAVLLEYADSKQSIPWKAIRDRKPRTEDETPFWITLRV